MPLAAVTAVNWTLYGLEELGGTGFFWVGSAAREKIEATVSAIVAGVDRLEFIGRGNSSIAREKVRLADCLHRSRKDGRTPGGLKHLPLLGNRCKLFL